MLGEKLLGLGVKRRACRVRGLVALHCVAVRAREGMPDGFGVVADAERRLVGDRFPGNAPLVDVLAALAVVRVRPTH